MNRRIDPNEPLPEAMALLTAANAVLARTVPSVSKNVSRRSRSFRRGFQPRGPQVAPTAPMAGATRHFRRATPAAVVSPMASALLMAGSRRQRKAPPRVMALDLVRQRAQALMLIGTLRERFRMNVLDMADNRADTNRMLQARARYSYLPSQKLVYL